LRVLECTVRRCIIDDKDLKLKVGIGDGEDTLDAAHERVLLVVCRDHKRELRHKCAIVSDSKEWNDSRGSKKPFLFYNGLPSASSSSMSSSRIRSVVQYRS